MKITTITIDYDDQEHIFDIPEGMTFFTLGKKCKGNEQPFITTPDERWSRLQLLFKVGGWRAGAWGWEMMITGLPCIVMTAGQKYNAEPGQIFKVVPGMVMVIGRSVVYID